MSIVELELYRCRDGSFWLSKFMSDGHIQQYRERSYSMLASLVLEMIDNYIPVNVNDGEMSCSISSISDIDDYIEKSISAYRCVIYTK